jgi:hypothetical protein
MAKGFDNTPPIPQRVIGNIIGGNFGGILATKPLARYMSGARTRLLINGSTVAWAYGITWRINTQFTEIRTIDSYLPHELAPQMITVEGTLSGLHIPGDSPGTQLLRSDVASFLFQRYITIEVRDTQTDQILFFAPRVMIIDDRREARTDSLNNVTLSWRAIGFRDERDPAQPEGFDQKSPSF